MPLYVVSWHIGICLSSGRFPHMVKMRLMLYETAKNSVFQRRSPFPRQSGADLLKCPKDFSSNLFINFNPSNGPYLDSPMESMVRKSSFLGL
jgi:hypothetical protein